jgi:hypothetical protein
MMQKNNRSAVCFALPFASCCGQLVFLQLVVALTTVLNLGRFFVGISPVFLEAVSMERHTGRRAETGVLVSCREHA